MVAAMRQYFEEWNPDQQSDVQRRTRFKGMQIMPDENEGKFALLAIKSLAKSGTDDLSKLIREKADQDLLVAMEQGGKSLQIWPGQDMVDDVFPEETGLYSNLGNNAIRDALKEAAKGETSCFNPVVTAEDRKTKPLPESAFSKDACRAELRALQKYRHDSDESVSHEMPKLLDGGLYVAFSTFYWAASNAGIAKKVMPVREALRKVKAFLAKEQTDEEHSNWVCPEGHVATKSGAPDELLCMQILALEMMLEEMVAKSEGIEADIIFHKKINGKALSWTVGVAEMMKPTIGRGHQIVVMDLGSSSTKIFSMMRNLDDSWSDMTSWGKNKDGDILKTTQPKESMRLLL